MKDKIKRIIELESKALQIGENIKSMREAQTGCSSEANQLWAEVIAEMQADGLVKEVYDEFDVSLREGRESIIIADDSSVPDEYTRIKREPDKVKIGLAAKEGLQANWFVIERKPTLTIKGKA